MLKFQTIKRVINNLSKREDIITMKQDKGRRVVIMDKTKYTDKCLALLSIKQFQTLNFDPTKSTESKVQRMLRKIKSKLPIQDYKHLYPTGSYPDTFYGTAKLHKILPNGHVDDLPIRPIVSNIGTATYNLSKYLAKM